MKTRILTLLLVTLLIASSATATSYPASFVVDKVNSNLQLLVTTPLGSAHNNNISLSGGSLTADIDQTGDLPPAINFTNVHGSASLNNFSLSPAILGVGTLSGSGLVLDLGPVSGAGPYPGNGSNPGTIDFSGLDGSIAAGILSATSFGTLIDFSTSPSSFILPAHSIANFNETGGPTTYALTLTIPISYTGTNVIGGIIPVTYTISGSVVYDGTKVVPEPSTLAIASAGLIGLVCAARRRRRKMSSTAAK